MAGSGGPWGGGGGGDVMTGATQRRTRGRRGAMARRAQAGRRGPADPRDRRDHEKGPGTAARADGRARPVGRRRRRRWRRRQPDGPAVHPAGPGAWRCWLRLRLWAFMSFYTVQARRTLGRAVSGQVQRRRQSGPELCALAGGDGGNRAGHRRTHHRYRHRARRRRWTPG